MVWVSASDLMTAAVGPDSFWYGSAEEEAICKRAHAGLLPTRAKAYFVERDESFNVLLPRGFWRAEDKPGLEKDWHRGDFSTRVNGYQERAFGVEFDRQAVEAMGIDLSAPNVIATPSAQMNTNRGGRKLASGWPEFVAELTSILHYDGFPDGVGTEGADALIEKVLTAMTERGADHTLGRSTVQPTVNAVLRRHRSAN